MKYLAVFVVVLIAVSIFDESFKISLHLIETFICRPFALLHIVIIVIIIMMKKPHLQQVLETFSVDLPKPLNH